MTGPAHTTFRSLRNRNFRLYAAGQAVSVVGTAMQQVAQGWLVLDLTDSGVALGISTALQFLPMLAFGLFGGLLADRVDKRRLLIATQVASGVLALALWALVTTDTVSLWSVYVLAFLLGCVFAVDMPARQSFVIEMVGPGDVTNAVGLNSAIFNGGRLVGPVVAGVLIATVGVGVCFLVNGLSYVAVVLALRAMRVEELQQQAPAPRERGQVRAGIRYVLSNPTLRSPLLLITVIGTLGFNFIVILPLLAKDTFGGGPRLYGLFASAMGLGSMVGGLVSAHRAGPSRKLLLGAGTGFGGAAILTALAPSPALAALMLVSVGLAMMLLLSTANATLQLNADPAMRGRVMALYGLVFLGSNPIGGPLIGWLCEHWGPRAGLAFGGIASLVAAGLAIRTAANDRRARTPSDDAGLLIEPAAHEEVA